MNKFLLILKKELLRVFGDPKLAIGLFVTPMLTMVVVYGFMGVFIGSTVTKTAEHLCNVYIIGEAPASLTARLTENECVITPATSADYEAISRRISDEEDADLLLVFPADFADAVARGESPEIEAVCDPSIEGSEKAYDIFTDAANQYRDELLAEKLGGADKLELFTPVLHSLENKEESAGRMIGSFVVMFIVIFIFSSSMQQGIDIIAGEKERGVFATLLMAPVSRTAIAAGKAISLTIVAVLAAFSIFVGILLSILVIALYFMIRLGGMEVVAQQIGGALSGVAGFSMFSVASLLTLLLQMVMIGILSATVICFVSSFTKTVKEAGSKITPIYLLVMLLCYLPLMSQGATAQNPLLYLIPLYGNINAIISLMSGTLTTLPLLFSVFSAIFFSALLIFLTGHVFQKEKYLF